MDAELAVEAGEEGIVRLVVHDEPGVHTVRTNGDRMDVTARVAVRLEELHSMGVRERVGSSQPGDPRPDDSYLHHA